MDIDVTGFYQISIALSDYYDCMYYIDVESELFMEFLPSRLFKDIPHQKSGNRFIKFARTTARKYVHPNDLKKIISIYDKKKLQELISNGTPYSVPIRLVLNDKIIHTRHVIIICEDKKHILSCIVNIENEVQEKAEQKHHLMSAERMARRDELTGIKNKNAFTEQSQIIDKKIRKNPSSWEFGVVMCDVNNLKTINDTRGHSFGDEAIQKASQMICEIFKHSPVFRIGGDEFIVLLKDSDYEHREKLLALLREESITNKKTRVGPVVASGLAVYEPGRDKEFSDVFNRADSLMYENKMELKTITEIIQKTAVKNNPITKERKRMLDGLFESYLTIAGDGYVFLNDMKHDFSRWAISLVDDFGLKSEYMYAADKIWEKFIHPDDLPEFRNVMKKILVDHFEVNPVSYRVRKPDGTYILVTFRGFVITDINNTPDYFGGIIVPK
ncbi:MAG: diguanylate cyclase [Treponema sp.]|nr:diguanylate cyclase [Treponema sp.]